jgi:hypothetical protein
MTREARKVSILKDKNTVEVYALNKITKEIKSADELVYPLIVPISKADEAEELIKPEIVVMEDIDGEKTEIEVKNFFISSANSQQAVVAMSMYGDNELNINKLREFVKNEDYQLMYLHFESKYLVLSLFDLEGNEDQFLIEGEKEIESLLDIHSLLIELEDKLESEMEEKGFTLEDLAKKIDHAIIGGDRNFMTIYKKYLEEGNDEVENMLNSFFIPLGDSLDTSNLLDISDTEPYIFGGFFYEDIQEAILEKQF